MRFHIKIEYDGSGLYGLQRQKGYASVQEHLEQAIFNFTGEEITLYAAGRTDAGVHAIAMSAHFDLNKKFTPHTIMMATHAHLATDQIRIIDCEIVGDDFHARFGAKRRSYLYRILNRPAPPALKLGRVWHISKPLDVAAMQLATQGLIGHHDFTSFRAAECQAPSPFKTLDSIEISKIDDEINIRFQAKSFLHHMVRNMVGTITLFGHHKNTQEMAEILNAKDRRKAGPTAPAEGLYFLKAEYE